jgi:hypothetical protein
MIVVAVLIGTIAKQHHFLGLPDWILEWVLPFLLMVAGYKARQQITESIEDPADPKCWRKMKERQYAF